MCFPDIAVYYRNQGAHARRPLCLPLWVTCAFPTCFPSHQTPTFRITESLRLEKTSQITLPHHRVTLLPPFSPPTHSQHCLPPGPQTAHPQQHTSSHPHRGCASPRPGPEVGCTSPGTTPVTPALPPWPGCWAHAEAVGHAGHWTLPLLGHGGHSPFSSASSLWRPRLTALGAAGGGSVPSGCPVVKPEVPQMVKEPWMRSCRATSHFWGSSTASEITNLKAEHL